MAEGLLRSLGKGKYLAFSAGTEATSVRPEAIRVMKEAGIDISKQKSKTLQQFMDDDFDYVITLCDQANESCPIFPNAKNREHWNFQDPSKAEGTCSEVLIVYRDVRDAIKSKIVKELIN